MVDPDLEVRGRFLKTNEQRELSPCLGPVGLSFGLKITDSGPWGGGGVLWISSDRDD